MGIRILDDYLTEGAPDSWPLDPTRGVPARGALALKGRTGATVARERRVAEYEQLKSEWIAQSYIAEEEIVPSINAKIAAMREREAAAA